MHQNLDEHLENLLAALRAGCNKAYTEIYELCSERVLVQAYYVLENDKDAEDVLQEVFLSLLEKRETLEIRTSLMNYLLKSAKNKAIDVLKVRAHHQKYVHQEAYVQPKTQSPGNQLENKEFIKNVHLGLERMPKLYGNVFKLYHLEGKGHQDVAEMLGISVYYSRTSVNRAINSLREFLKNLD